MRFEFATANRIIFGPGAVREVGPLAKAWGPALVVTGRSAGRAEVLLAGLRSHRVEATVFAVAGEPDVDIISAGVALAREAGCRQVIGFGGGSAIDAGKAIAVMMGNPGSVLDYLEVVGAGKTLLSPSAPFVAVPTTAGTGAEVTRNAVLASKLHGVKASLRSATMLPKCAVIDPLLTHSLPPAETAATGLDALTQLIEPFVGSRANPFTDALCRDGLSRVAGALVRAMENGTDAAAREDMSLAALYSGIALANAGLGAVHGFAGPIGGMFPAPHGAVCAALLPAVMAANRLALQERQPASPTLARFAEVARLLTGNPNADAADGEQWVGDLVRKLGIPGLRAYGVAEEHVPELVKRGLQASSMKANPIALTEGELSRVLRESL